MTKWPSTEVELARPVVAWLQDLGWEVFQEVATPGGDVADIVARRGRVLWVVEVKRTFGLAVLGQALQWTRRAHKVSVAVPSGRSTKARYFAEHSAARDGIGILEARRDYLAEGVKVTELSRPAFRRRVLGIDVFDAQKTFAEAGNASGKRWSPFKETCKRVREVVEREPGLTVREVVERVDHHYASPASAKGSLLQWARAGSLEGVVVRGGTKETGHFRLYPEAWQGPTAPRRPR